MEDIGSRFIREWGLKSRWSLVLHDLVWLVGQIKFVFQIKVVFVGGLGRSRELPFPYTVPYDQVRVGGSYR